MLDRILFEHSPVFLCAEAHNSGRRSPPSLGRGESGLSMFSAGSPLGSRNTSGLSAAADSGSGQHLFLLSSCTGRVLTCILGHWLAARLAAPVGCLLPEKVVTLLGCRV